MKITANKFVAVTYDLNVGEGEERELMEKAVAEAPLKFIFGTGAMLPAFEDALKGLEVGDKFDFSIAPADAYGEWKITCLICQKTFSKLKVSSTLKSSKKVTLFL